MFNSFLLLEKINHSNNLYLHHLGSFKQDSYYQKRRWLNFKKFKHKSKFEIWTNGLPIWIHYIHMNLLSQFPTIIMIIHSPNIKISTKFYNLFWHLMSFLAPWNVFWPYLVIVLEVEPTHRVHPKGIFEGHLINEDTQMRSLGLQWKLLVIFVDCVDHWIS